MRVLIEIATAPGVAGGVAQSTQGLIKSLGLLDGPDRYVLAARTPDQAEWIRPYCGRNQEIIIRDPRWRTRPPLDGATTGRSRRVGHLVKRALRPALEGLRTVVGRLTPQTKWPALPVSDGYYESLGCDVLHFPTQGFTLCALPTIYNPHDLQHLHYPQFFTPEELANREITYRAACRLSHTIVVGSQWIKQDVIRQFAVHADKVQVIPWASPTEYYPPISPSCLDEARRRFALPDKYAFYPAVTWPHKNHLRLLDALASIRDTRGVVVHLVCSGTRYESHWPNIQRRIKELGLESQVKFLGFVSEADLRALYRLAEFLVLPTLFEADSCPIHEAWSEGLPVASSNHTALPEQVGDAGLLFDAGDVAAIAHALERMATEPGLRRILIERGHRRVRDFDWERTATAYRAVYRRAAGITLTDEDRWLLTWDWMREPRESPYVDNGHER
jgi:glycosyltransferase involved in cell wall biosynthesis